MKAILFIFLCLLSFVSFSRAQAIAMAEQPGLGYRPSAINYNFAAGRNWHKEHCWATRAGKSGMIIGAASCLVGGVFILASDNNSQQQNYVPAQVYIGLFFLVCGEIHDATQRRRFSIIGSANSVGVAYNF